MKKTIHRGKILLALLLCAMMAAGLLPGTAKEAKTETAGDYQYKLNDDSQTVTITKYIGTGSNITIPETIGDYYITGIDEKAFQNTQITDLTIPASVARIGNQAFSNCTDLTVVRFEEGSDTITLGSGLFEGCTNLKTAVLSGRITSTNDRMFCGCTKLSSVTYPETLSVIGKQAFANTALDTADLSGTKLGSIGEGAFSGCTAIASLKFPTGQQMTIGDTAFSGCGNIENLVIPATVTGIGKNAFADSGLKSVTFAAGDSSIALGSGAFRNCQALEKAEISSRVTEIGTEAFSGCSRLNIQVPESVTSIGSNAFKDCRIAWQCRDSVLRILSTGNIPDYSSAGSAPWYGSCASIQSISLNDSVTGIGAGAFAGLRYLTSITIPAGMKKIGNEAFSNCPNLSDVTIENESTSFGKDVFKDDPKVTIHSHKNSTAETYAGENNLPFVSLDWIISFNAGGGSGTMADQGVVKGQQYTLPACSFTAPRGKEFDTWDKGVPGKKINVTGNMVITALWKDKPADPTTPPPSTTTPPPSTTTPPPSTTTPPPSTTTPPPSSDPTPAPAVDDETTASGGVYSLNHEKQTATFVRPVNKNAKTLRIPDTVTANGKDYKVTEIRAKACRGMKKLTTLVIGKNISKIGKQAFEKCKKLKKITIKNAKMKKNGFGSKCFSGIAAKAKFKVPKAALKNYTKWIKSRGKAPKTATVRK